MERTFLLNLILKIFILVFYVIDLFVEIWILQVCIVLFVISNRVECDNSKLTSIKVYSFILESYYRDFYFLFDIYQFVIENLGYNGHMLLT